MYPNCIFYVRFCTTRVPYVYFYNIPAYAGICKIPCPGHQNMAGTWDIGTRDIHVSREPTGYGTLGPETRSAQLHNPNSHSWSAVVQQLYLQLCPLVTCHLRITLPACSLLSAPPPAAFFERGWRGGERVAWAEAWRRGRAPESHIGTHCTLSCSNGR